MKYKDFDSLPLGIQERVKVLHPNDYKDWIKEAIPALKGQSIIEVINEDDGMVKISQYLNKVEGYLSIK